MSVKVVAMQGNTGSKAITKFADTLTGADRPFLIGNDWFTQFTSDSTTAMVDVSGELNIGAAGLVWGNGSGLNLNGTNIGCYPSLVSRGAVVAKSLTTGVFAELTLVSRPIAGVGAGIGPSVFMNPGDDVQYLLQINSSNTNTVLFRKNHVGYTTLVANCFTNTPGDVCRLEGRYVGGFPELRVYQNGVLMSTFVDNSGLGTLIGGEFGFFLSGVFSGEIVMNNFNGGTL